MTGFALGDAGDLHGGVDRLRPGPPEEDTTPVVGGQVGDDVGETFRRLVREGGERVICSEGGRLLGDGLDHLGATVADVHVPEAGHRIEVGVAIVVPDRGALAPHDAHEVLLPGGGERVEEGAHVREARSATTIRYDRLRHTSIESIVSAATPPDVKAPSTRAPAKISPASTTGAGAGSTTAPSVMVARGAE